MLIFETLQIFSSPICHNFHLVLFIAFWKNFSSFFVHYSNSMLVPPFPQGYESADGYNSDFSLEELSGDEKKEKDGLLQGNDSSYGIIQRAQGIEKKK